MENILLTTIFMALLSLVAANFKLEVVHTNDMHSRFHQTNKVSGICSNETAKRGECYGGFARVSEAVRLAKGDRSKKTLFLIAGDIYQGTIWYTVYKWRIVSVLTNMLQPDAMVSNVSLIVLFTPNHCHHQSSLHSANHLHASGHNCPLKARVFQPTACLMSTFPQKKVKNHLASTGVTHRQHVESRY